MSAHSSILAWGIPGTEEPGGLYSSWGCRVRHNWTSQQARTDLSNKRRTNDLLLQCGKELLLRRSEVSTLPLPWPGSTPTALTIIPDPGFLVCCSSFHEPVAGLPTFLPRNSFALILWMPTQSSYLPKEIFQKTAYWIFYGICVCFSFKKWAGRKRKIGLVPKGSKPSAWGLLSHCFKLSSISFLASSPPHMIFGAFRLINLKGRSSQMKL